MARISTARISTGQAFGPTGRQTSQRLLGAAEQMATPGILAQSSISQPALQPQAEPVDLFQQVGAPTLGGPVRMFEPSPLPGPSQDMAALARALGNFSPILQTFGEQYVQRLKTEDERAKLIGQQFASDLRAKYPGQQLVELRDQLYRQAQAGDATAAEAYNKVQALSPLQLAYANRYNELALTRDSISSAAERFSQLADIDGTPLNQIPPGDPRLKAAQISLVRATSDPVVFAELAPEAERQYAAMDRHHATVHRAEKSRQAAVAAKNNLVSVFMSKRIDPAAAAGELTRTLDDARIKLGTEDYQTYVESIIPWMAEAVASGSLVKDKPDLGTFIAKRNAAHKILGQIRVGPGGQTSLVEQLGAKGGMTAVLRLEDELVKAYKAIDGPIDYLDKESGESWARKIAAQFRIGDPTLTPAEAVAAKTQALQAVALLPKEQQPAAVEEIRRQSEGAEMIAAGQQKLVESSYQFDYSKDPATEIAKLENLRRNMLVSQPFADRTIQRYRELQSEDQRPYVNAAKEGKKILMEQELDAMKRPGSEGSKALSDGERQRLIQRSAEISADIEAIRRRGVANNLTPAQLRGELDKYIKEQSEKTRAAPAARITTPPAYNSPKEWSDKLGFWGRQGPGNRAKNYQLQQQVQNRALFPKNVYDENFKRFLLTGELSDPLRLMIKRAGYQNKPAQFFVDQWEHVHGKGVPIPKDLEGRIQELNGLKISFAQPAQSPMMRSYAAVSNAITTKVLNAIAPPAMAAQGGGFSFMGGTSFERPASVVYERPGGQPGVDYWFPSKQFPAVLPGRVKDIGREPGYGNYVVIESADPRNGRTVDVLYGHLPNGGIFVQPGQTVQPGQVIGRQGGTGNVDSVDGTIASVDFLAPRPAGSRDMTPYGDFDGLRRYVTASLQRGGGTTAAAPQRPTTRRGGGMTGIATYYTGSGGQDGVAGGLTANNERYDPSKMTAAVQWSLRGKYLNKWLLVEDLDTGKTIRVWANDVGPMGGDEKSPNKRDPRIIDFSPAAFRALYGSLDRGTSRVRVRIDPNQRRR